MIRVTHLTTFRSRYNYASEISIIQKCAEYNKNVKTLTASHAELRDDKQNLTEISIFNVR